MTKKSEGLVSVIVPIYKVEPYLERCLDSIIRQTYTNLEIILIDDGSPDGCGAICDRYKERDSRIIVIHKENGGLSSARNAGLDICTGDFISFVDSDDYIELDMIEVMVSAMIETDADISTCGRFGENLIQNTISLQMTLSSAELFSKEETMKMILIGKGIDVAVWDKIYKNNIWKNIRFPEGHIYEDMMVIPQVIYLAESIIHVGKPLYHYVHRENSITTAYREKNIKDYKFAIRTVFRKVEEIFPSVKEELVYYKNNMYLSLLYMCILYNYNGEEEKEAYDYLKKNWDKKYSRDRIVKKGRITLIHWFIRLGLARQALGVKKYLRSILKKNNRVQEN